MGRETKILLGLLGMLAFVFLGALLARLFVARPPVGLGVDIHANVAVSEPGVIVAPPELGRPERSAFAAAPPAVTDAAEPTEPERIAAEPVAAEPVAIRSVAVADATAVVPAAFEEPADRPTAGLERPAAGMDSPTAGVDREIRQGEKCTVVEGDAWWDLAEAAYGDGRWYRGLYAWNRAIDPAVSLLPGTKLVVPTAAELEAAYPGLIPKGQVPRRQVPRALGPGSGR